jgi:DNA-binding CsgD family transcriptional regulator
VASVLLAGGWYSVDLVQVAAGFPLWGRGGRLIGRPAECAALERLLDAIRAGESRALVVHGEPGAGKTVLMEYLAGRAPDCRVARTAGVQSEMELAFAGLHQMCAPMLDRLETLPVPQGAALQTAFGLSPGPPPDRFLAGLAVLGLLSAVAAEKPLVCLVDDAQWLDRASAQVLAFVARRLGAESVGLLFGSRVQGGDLAGLPELVIRGLPEADARTLLDSALTGPIDARVRDQIVAETHGNPLALLELPRGLTVAELAGGFGLPGTAPLSGSVEESFRRRAVALPDDTRSLLLLAAADPTGDPALVWRAASQRGIDPAAAWPAAEADLIEFGAQVRFRHPLVRSAVYRSASVQGRQDAHRALAEATDPDLDPDRRSWHRAQATPGPAEDVATELERSAGRAQARGGLAAAAAFLEQAVRLTLDPVRHTERALAAANAEVQAGGFDAALELLITAQEGPLDELGRARADLLHAEIAYAQSRGSDAPPLLLRAAQRLEPLDIRLARRTYLDALSAAYFAGSSADEAGVGVTTVARAVLAAPRPSQRPSPLDLFLEGTATLCTEGYAASVPILKQALGALRDEEFSGEERLECSLLTYRSVVDLWDDESWYVLASRNVKIARESGALTALQFALNARIVADAFMGDLTAGSTLMTELAAVCEATGSFVPPYSPLALAAWRGREAEVSELAEMTTKEVLERGEGLGLSAAQWAIAMLSNGLGRYADALAAAERAGNYQDIGFSDWSLAELILAAVRCGEPERAAAALSQLTARARACRTDWALGVEARSRALLSEGEAAERLYREAIARLGRTRVRAELARTHLLYGEWLRRERRRGDAREQLRTAHGMLEAMGLEAFAEQARGELLAAGETARRSAAVTRDVLTAQEAQVARLARDGLSNPEIAARLFVSPRTVQYHLGKVFSKLGITSRNQLGRALSTGELTDP